MFIIWSDFIILFKNVTEIWFVTACSCLISSLQRGKSQLPEIVLRTTGFVQILECSVSSLVTNYRFGTALVCADRGVS